MASEPRAPDVATAPGAVGRRSYRWVPPVLILALLAVGFPALRQYNVTWDEALGDLFFGERYFSFFTSLDPVYLDFSANPYPPDHRPDLSASPFRDRPWEYYPFANTLAAATSALLSRWLGLLDPFDGFHAVNLLFAAVLVGALFPFLRRRFGPLAATAALGLLFGSPRVVCHLMANVKDFPLMVLFTLTCTAFLGALEAGSALGLLGAGALWGLALATKANALFLPAIPLVVLVAGGWPEPWRQRRRRLLLALCGAGILGVAVMVAVWPYLWADPIGRFRQHLDYIGFRHLYTRPENLVPVIRAVLLTTPPTFLVLFAIGLIPAAKRALARDRTALLLLAWIGVVLGRYLPARAVNFDGVRHFLELFPALAAIAGLGLAWLGGLLAGRFARSRKVRNGSPTIRVALLLLALVPGFWAVVRSHPFQIAYWNLVVGGYPGARDAGLPQAGDYWGMSYRLGLDWLDRNAEEGALLAVPVVEHAVRLVAPERLREDIRLLPLTSPVSPRMPRGRLERTRQLARERPVYVMFVDRSDWTNDLMRDCQRQLEPQVVWKLEGAPVLAIYRYRWPLSGPGAGD